MFDDWKVVPSSEYSYGAVPLVAVAVITPVLTLVQAVGVAVAVKPMAVPGATVASTVPVQPLSSRIVMV